MSELNVLTSSEQKPLCSLGPFLFLRFASICVQAFCRGRGLFPAKKDLFLPPPISVPLLPHILQRKGHRITDRERGQTPECKEMKGTSKVIMGATLVMVVTLAVVLGLIFVLLAELYCSLLIRRRHLRNSNSNTLPTATIQPTTTTIANAPPSHTTIQPQQQSPPFRSIYAQGVLQAPRSILLPTVSCKEDKAGPRKHHSEPPQLVQIQIQTQESNLDANPSQVGVIPNASPPPSFISIVPSKPSHENPLPSGSLCHDDNKPCSGGERENLVYISNPIYESQGSGANTPFETPETSPSRFERSSSSEEDEAPPCGGNHSPPYTPPLTPMKKLPAEACSVSLRDARSLGTSGSDSHSNNGISSSSSGSPCTSPSW